MAEKEKIQELPEGWTVKVVDDLCEILDSKRVPISDENRQLMKGDIPYYGANGVVDYINKFIFNEDLLLLAEDGGHFEEWMTKPIAYRVSGKSWVNNHAHVLKNKNGVSLGFVFYNLEHRNITYYISGGTRGKLNQSQLRSMPVLIPQSIIEQTRIASILSTCDEAIEKTDVKIEKLKCIKQGLMQDFFRYGIDENGNLRSEATHRFKDSPLGRIPEEWEVVNIFDVCKLINGRAFKPSEWSESGLPIIRIENLNNYEAEFNYCNFRVAAKHLIFKGDLLISWSGTPGTSFGIFEWGCGEAVLNQHIFKVILGSSIEKKYFYYSYINLLDEMIRQSHGGVGLQHITKEDLKRLRILLPKKPEQSRIACVLSSADEAIEKEEAYKNKLLALKRGLMDDLLSGKVRVNKLIKEAA